MDSLENDITAVLKERFDRLPKVVQQAITSAEVEQHLRQLSETHKLHLDQWQVLENQVMLTLLGIHPVEELARHIQTEVDVPLEVATALATDISHVVFEPIRTELAHLLQEPTQETALTSPPRPVGTPIPISTSSSASVSAPAEAPVVPATPPAPGPTQKAVRAPASGAYKPGEPSTARANIVDDPYRETPA